MYEAIVIGGGLGGITVAIELARHGFSVLVIEKSVYPFHKVCGEYFSNEVRPYLERTGLDITQLGASSINRFQFTSAKGKVLNTTLQHGGFGVSRYKLDYELYKIALTQGVHFELNASVENTEKINEAFFVDTNTGKTFQSKILIGAYGKRSKADQVFQRPISQQKTSYLGVKYHVSLDYPKDLTSLHYFKGGYCGLSAIEDNKFCLCYLSSQANLKNRAGAKQLEEDVLYQNPFLKEIFTNARHHFQKPEIITGIVFARKSRVHNHIIMVGDSAGLITPLAGSGVSVAVRSAFLAARLIGEFLHGNISRNELEQLYLSNWDRNFKRQLWRGRQLQHLFSRQKTTEIAVRLLNNLPSLMPLVIKSAQGRELPVE